MQAEGLAESLFRRLTAAHPAAVVALTRQFRMNGPIMALNNRLTYGSQLRAGSPAIEHATLAVPGLLTVRYVHAAFSLCLRHHLTPCL